MNSMNPLSKFTKMEVYYTKLISNDVIKYPEGVLGKTGIECGICARSSRDELMFNNPDALMNGEAIVKVIENCVPNVLDAHELFVPDVELLLIAIKLATKESTYTLEVNCPKCNERGAFERDLEYLLNSAEVLTEQPTLVLEDIGGLVLKFRPHTWKEHSAFALRMFKEQKTAQVLEASELTDDEKMKEFSAIFENMTQLSFDMIVANIQEVEVPDGESITSSEFISEWLSTLPTYILAQIKEKSDYINNIGVSHEMEVGCSHCNHEWTLTNLSFDPSNFFVPNFSSLNQKK